MCVLSRPRTSHPGKSPGALLNISPDIFPQKIASQNPDLPTPARKFPLDASSASQSCLHAEHSNVKNSDKTLALEKGFNKPVTDQIKISGHEQKRLEKMH